MRDTPLLMKGALVRATFADFKLVTRRLSGLDYINNNPEGWQADRDDDDFDLWHFRADGYGVDVRCRYGQPGDKLWVRESFIPAPTGSGNLWSIAYAAGGMLELEAPPDYNPALYNYERWTPSIHMPKFACRLHLCIIDIRPERLQEITPADCMKEGTLCWSCGGLLQYSCREGANILHTAGEATTSFKIMWDKINPRHPWDDNPWVWRIQFERLP